MKKILVMSALVAFSAAFVACSSDDDLVQQKPEVPEESVEEGIPMTIKVADFASRGRDLTINELENFTLYSTMYDSWKSGKLIGKDAGGNWTTNGDLAWNGTSDYTFYGINDVANLTIEKDGSNDVIKIPTVSESTVSFGYTMPQELKPKIDPDDPYEPDVYWCNSMNLVDLLVSKNTENSETNDGALVVDFNHALAQITAIYVYANTTRLENRNPKILDHQTYRFRINGIRLCGLKAAGTYTFDAVTPWTVSGDDMQFNIPLNIPADDEVAFKRMSFIPGAKDVNHAEDQDETKTTLKLPFSDGDDGLYLIPQAANGQIVKNTGWESEGAYAELDAQVFVYGDADHTTATDNGIYHCSEDDQWLKFDTTKSKASGFGQIQVPLKFTLEPGKGYSLTLDLSRGIIVSGAFEGEPIFEGVTFDTN